MGDVNWGRGREKEVGRFARPREEQRGELNAPVSVPLMLGEELQPVCDEVHSMRTGLSQERSVSHICLYFARRRCWRRKHVQDFKTVSRVSRSSLGH